MPFTDAQRRFIYVLLTMISGPAFNLLARKFDLAAEDTRDWLDILSAVTMVVGAAWGFTSLNPAGLVRSAATLPADQARQALARVSDATKVQVAASVPGVEEIVVRPTATNGLAATAHDPRQTKVVMKTIIMMVMAGGLLLTGGGLTACTSTGELDRAKLEQYEQTAELVYTGARLSLAVLCASVPDRAPCNSAAAMAHIGRATEVLDEAFAQAQVAIAAARTTDGAMLALTALQSAVTVYAKVLATYGLNRGGG